MKVLIQYLLSTFFNYCLLDYLLSTYCLISLLTVFVSWKSLFTMQTDTAIKVWPFIQCIQFQLKLIFYVCWQKLLSAINTCFQRFGKPRISKCVQLLKQFSQEKKCSKWQSSRKNYSYITNKYTNWITRNISKRLEGNKLGFNENAGCMNAPEPKTKFNSNVKKRSNEVEGENQGKFRFKWTRGVGFW